MRSSLYVQSRDYTSRYNWYSFVYEKAPVTTGKVVTGAKPIS